MLTVKEIKLEDNLDWDELIKKSDTSTFFQTKEWLEIWTKHFSGEIKILGVFEDSDLMGIVPFQINNDTVSILGLNSVLGGELVSDFGDIIALNGREKEVWEEVLANIKNQKSQPKADQPRAEKIKNTNQKLKIEFSFIRENSPSFKVLQELGGKAEEVDVAPYIDLPKTWEEYLGSLNRHDRHELRRKMRKIEAEGVTLVDYRGDSNDIEEFFQLMIQSNEQKRNFLSREMKAFFLDIIKTFYPDKMTLIFLRIDRNYLAAALTFLFKDEVLLYNSGFDAGFSHLSPGLTLKAYLIKKAIEDGRKRFDFLRGGERYKYNLGGKVRKLYKIIL